MDEPRTRDSNARRRQRDGVTTYAWRWTRARAGAFLAFLTGAFFLGACVDRQVSHVDERRRETLITLRRTAFFLGAACVGTSDGGTRRFQR